MNRIATSIALASAALATQLASAASFVGNFTGSLVSRSIVGMTQTTVVGQFPALPVRVVMCNGTIETPVFVISSATVAQANGSCYSIRATIGSTGDRTTFEIKHSNSGNNGIKSVTFGNGTQAIIFDRTQPSPGTAGSLTGRDVTYLGGAGLWSMRAFWANPIRIGTAAPVGDVYNTLTIDFNACFDTGDWVRFDVDTDMVG